MSALVIALMSELPEAKLAEVLRELPDGELVDLVRRGVEAQEFAAALARPAPPSLEQDLADHGVVPDDDEDEEDDVDVEDQIDEVILRHLREADEQGTSTSPIAAELGVTGQTIRKHLRRLEQEGQAQRTGAGPSTRWHAAD